MQLQRLESDPAFLRVENSLRQFNIFEAVGAVRQELRHSDFLAFLLNPYSNHGFKGKFIEILLSEIANLPNGKSYLASFPIRSGIFDNAEVRREWQYIDILVRCPASKAVLIIENKVDSCERDDQLEQYWKTVVKEFPRWKVFGFYVTPDAEQPSSKTYLALGYELISRSLETLLQPRELVNDLKTAVKHYNAMIKQKIIATSPQVENECWKIYTRHKQAFELIRECVDQSDPIRKFLKELISQESPRIKFSHDRPGFVQFQPIQWHKAHFLDSKRRLEDLLFFEFQYGDAQRAKGALVLLLAINTADSGKRDPKRVFDLAKQNSPPFIVQRSFTQWSTIFRQELISREDMDNFDLSTQKKVKQRWNDFLSKTLPSLNKAIHKHFTV